MTQLAKWGNSVGIRLPQDVLKHLDMKKGTEVKIYESRGRIIIEKSKTYTLDNLLQTKCSYGEISTGEAIGQEEW